MSRSGGESIYVCPFPWLVGEHEEWREEMLREMWSRLNPSVVQPWWMPVLEASEQIEGIIWGLYDYLEDRTRISEAKMSHLVSSITWISCIADRLDKTVRRPE